MVSYKFDVLYHVIRIHANEGDREGFRDEADFDGDSFFDNAADGERGCWVREALIVDVDREVAMEPLVS